jgi:hypothetical protein
MLARVKARVWYSQWWDIRFCTTQGEVCLSICRTPWTGYQPVARSLPAYRTAQTQNKRTHTSMCRVGFEPTIPAFERAKTVHALDCAATMIGISWVLRMLNTHSLTHRAESFMRNRQLCSYSRTFPPFYEPEVLLQCSQEPSTTHYP